MEAEELFRKIRRYKAYFGEQGGVTVSGGEALLQPEFVTELFRSAMPMASTPAWIPADACWTSG